MIESFLKNNKVTVLPDERIEKTHIEYRNGTEHLGQYFDDSHSILNYPNGTELPQDKSCRFKPTRLQGY